MPPQFTWSDAWLLLSIALTAGQHPASLKDVIACGDGVNHAIFTPAELRRGLAKLTAQGHVTVRGGNFEVSPDVLRVVASEKERGAGRGDLQKRMERFLDAAPYPAGHPHADDPDWPFPQLTDSMISAAVREYHKEFWRRLEEIRRRDP